MEDTVARRFAGGSREGYDVIALGYGGDQPNTCDHTGHQQNQHDSDNGSEEPRGINRGVGEERLLLRALVRLRRAGERWRNV